MEIARPHPDKSAAEEFNDGSFVSYFELWADDVTRGSRQLGYWRVPFAFGVQLHRIPIRDDARALWPVDAQFRHGDTLVGARPQGDPDQMPWVGEALILDGFDPDDRRMDRLFTSPRQPVESQAPEADQKGKRRNNLRIANSHVFTIESVLQPSMVEHPLPAGQSCPDLSVPAAGRATYVGRRAA